VLLVEKGKPGCSVGAGQVPCSAPRTEHPAGSVACHRAMPSKLSAQGQTKTPLLFVSCSMSGHHHCEPASPGGQRVAVLFSIPKNGESIVLRGRKGQESKHVFTGNKPASSKSVPGSPAGLKIPRKGLELHAVCFLSSPAVSSHPHSSTQ